MKDNHWVDDVRRVTIFCGHYGSGKTNIAVNYALALAGEGYPVRIADLDIVNPYFRTKDSADTLQAAGIDLISPAFANSNVDLPALPAQLYRLVQQRDAMAVMDVGGDDRGAYALGRYRPYILEENDYDMLYVVNFHRPLTQTPEEAFAVLKEIEQAAGIPFTAIVNNTNLGKDTTAEDVEASILLARRLSEMAQIPLKMTTVREDIYSQLDRPRLFALHLQKQYYELDADGQKNE